MAIATSVSAYIPSGLSPQNDVDELSQSSSKSPSKKENSILIASGFPEDVSPYKIFRIFSLYGNVTKVKIMFK